MAEEQTAFRIAIALTEKPKPFAQIEEIEKAIKTYEVRKGFERSIPQHRQTSLLWTFIHTSGLGTD